ncbi:cytidylyltransferase domain-containing protein [Shewanella pneumatophori]|uniref:Acylneuraminate cytidylyltransferase family protein n=1 Tax=Shewanella pneumatophori TaxID=314092 RepID=A0A9X2CGZ9_9GAMM|nr:acylneuraminate cytidylyltransferase family protein [Shewanella pneumatophori]MCL1139591.1 acylneuraminate cytidylyltransferase family protein [Shewanella pneumatophori]
MFNQNKVLAIIPARGGSKRLPNKNLMMLVDKPLISWTIEAALLSQYIDRVIVSTDSYDIKQISESYGADVPFIRPPELAADDSSSSEVILHVLQKLDVQYDVVVMLQPTSPMRSFMHIDESLETMLNNQADGIVSVTPCEHSPLWAGTLSSDGSLTDFLDVNANRRSQELPNFYRLNGAIFCYKVENLILNNGINYKNNIFPYFMDRYSSVDIDTKDDFDYAEYLLLKG